MRLHVWPWALCLMFLVSVVSGRAFAQTAPADNVDHFAEGVRLYDAGAYDRALVEFEAAYRSSPTPATLYNLGRVHAELEHSAEAVQWLEGFLAQAGTRVTPAIRAEVQGLLREHRRRIARLDAHANVAQAMLLIDGREVARLPLDEPLRINPGAHTIRVEAPGYSSFERRIDVASGERIPFEAELVQLAMRRGSMRIVCALNDVEVRLDGELVGETPLQRTVSIEPGEHFVSARRTGYVQQQRQITIADNAEVTVEFDMELSQERDPETWGRLDLNLPDASQRVRVDGRTFDADSLIDLPVGAHELDIEVADRQPFHQRIFIHRGETLEVTPPLTWAASAREQRLEAASRRRMWAWIGVGIGGAVAIGGAAYLGWGEGRVGARASELDNCVYSSDTYLQNHTVATPSDANAFQTAVGESCFSSQVRNTDGSFSNADGTMLTGTPTSAWYNYSSLPASPRVSGLLADDLDNRVAQRDQARIVGGVLVGAGLAGAVASFVVAIFTPNESTIDQDASADASDTSPTDVRVQVGVSPTALSVYGSF